MTVINKKLDSELAYEALVDLLLSGTIDAEHALSERRLSEVLGYGRTPIREAVRDLIREGVLESHPTRGTIVRPLSIHDLQDLYEIRIAIEGLAASLAAKRGPVEMLEPYKRSFEQTLNNKNNLDVAAVHDYGVDFHKKIVTLSGNKRLIEMYHPFRLRFRLPFGIVRTRTPERVVQAVSEHLEVLKAIMSRKSDLAEELIGEHLRKGRDFRIDMLMNRRYYKI